MNIKKLIFVHLFLLFFSNCRIYAQECESYRVVNIDSTESYYLIMVGNNEGKYLIASPKKQIKPKRKIFLSKSYSFELVKHKWIEELPLNMMDAQTLLVIEGKTIWRAEDDYSVYSTKNLKGLNYIKRCGCPN